MTIISIVSFAVGIWTIGNKVEFMAMRMISPRFLDYLAVAAWTVFAWTMGLFAA